MMFATKRRAVSVDICAEVEMCYRDKRYSDLEIRCGKGNLDDRVVYCHRLIMAAVAPKLRDVLRLSDDSELPAVLQIPDFEPAKVGKDMHKKAFGKCHTFIQFQYILATFLQGFQVCG